MLTTLRFLPFTLIGLLSSCIEPSSEVVVSSTQPPGSVTGPDGPAPNQSAYQCSTSTAPACTSPRSRVWLPGWIVTAAAARGNKVAFSAYPTKPEGEADLGAPLQAGQIDLTTGNLDWIVPLGTSMYDFRYSYDMTLTPQGDVIFAAMGYGTMFVGEGGYHDDGFLAVLDSSGKQRFGKRLEIWDTPPTIPERPTFVNARIIADDVLRVNTGFYVTPPGQPTYTAIHLFSFTLDGTQMYRKEVPTVPETYNTHTWPVADGTAWVYHFPGLAYRYSKDGEILDTLEIDKGIDMRGFIAMGSTFGLLNFTTKGMTNELHRFDLELTQFVPLFNEPTPPQFHAASFRQTLGFAKTYFYEMGYDGLSHRFSTIDANGNRGPVTTVAGVTHQFTLFDDGIGVFFRLDDAGTEFIAQSL